MSRVPPGLLKNPGDGSRRCQSTGRILRSCLVAVALVLVTLGAAPTARSAVPGVVSDLTWFPPQEQRAREAALIRESGSRWVRLDIGWRDFEPSKGNYSPWAIANYEKEFQRARAAGQKVIVMVHTSPQWASGSSNKHTPPSNPADYGDFLLFIASRYAQYVDAWEIWNEENHPRFWSTGPNPAQYTSLLKAAYPAVKQKDPAAKVVFGGLSNNDYGFIQAAYKAGAKGYFDVMATHPYPCGHSPEAIYRYSDGRTMKSMFLAYREVRRTMLAHGDKKPIWFTEFGWSSTSRQCGVSEATQADYLSRAYKLLEQDPYVEVATWYSFRNHFWTSDVDDIESRYGLVRSDFSLKPAYRAFQNYATRQTPPMPKAGSRSKTTDAPRKRSSRPPKGPWMTLRLSRRRLAMSGARRVERLQAHGRVRVATPRVKIVVHQRTGRGRWARKRGIVLRVRGGQIRRRLGRFGRGRFRVKAFALSRRDLRPVTVVVGI